MTGRVDEKLAPACNVEFATIVTGADAAPIAALLLICKSGSVEDCSTGIRVYAGERQGSCSGDLQWPPDPGDAPAS